MAATNLGCTWRRNTRGHAAPFKFPLNFQSGAVQPVKSGEILDLSGAIVPLGSDKAMANIIAVSEAEIRSGDLAGYRMAIIPQPGDLFEYALAAAAAPAVAAPLYWASSQSLSVTPGVNVIGTVVDESTIPVQGFQSVNPSFDAGTTIRTVSKVLMTFKNSTSYYGALFT